MMSVSESCLVDLINQRFDDLNARIDELKIDTVKRQDQHEVDDKARFEKLQNDLSGLKNLKLTIMGAASGAFVVVQAAAKIIEHYWL